MATSFSDYSNPYITEIYNQKKQAAADALTSAYQQNMANYDAQEQQTAQNYDNQRNHTQAQYEQALRNFDEYSGANGLNSGAKAQARLAYGNQNQAGLSNLSAAESAALQQIARDRAGAQSQYQADLAANESAYDTDLYNALYGAWQDQVAQDNADRSYYNSLAMNTIQTGSVPDANTLQKAGIDANTAATLAAYYANLRQQEQAEADRAYYYTLAMDTLQTGNMPDANTLEKAGIDSGTAGSISAYYKALLTPAASSSGGGGSSRSSGGSRSSSSGSGDSGNGDGGLVWDWGGNNNDPNATRIEELFLERYNQLINNGRTDAQARSLARNYAAYEGTTNNDTNYADKILRGLGYQV